MFKWILFFIIDFFLFYSFSFRAGWIGFVLIFLKFLWDTGLFTGIKFYKAIFKNSEIFYVEYVGEYYLINKEFDKLNLVMQKFNLNVQNYTLFGIYYDDPKKVDPKKCRAVLGILKETDADMRPSAISKDEDLTDYLISNKFKKGILPDTECLFASFPFLNSLSMVLGIKKFYSALYSGLQTEEFKKMYNIDKKKFKFSLEVYKRCYNEIQFYIPLKNYDKFNLHSIKDE